MTSSPIVTSWSTCWTRARAACSGGRTTPPSTGPSRCTSSAPTTSGPSCSARRRGPPRGSWTAACCGCSTSTRPRDRTAKDGSALLYVVNEWATGISLDILVGDEGPLAPRRAAWLVGEVAATIEVAHAAGVAHGRLVPENVLIDRTGSVRVIGFAVDAALHGLPTGRVSADVTDLAGLLYAALTARWAGVSQSLVKGAPHQHGQVLRPRQVRAGVPRVLDTLCDSVLNPYAGAPGSHARGNYDLTTAGGIGDALREFVGDPAGLADAEVAAVRRREAGGTRVGPLLPGPMPLGPVASTAPDAGPDWPGCRHGPARSWPGR